MVTDFIAFSVQRDLEQMLSVLLVDMGNDDIFIIQTMAQYVICKRLNLCLGLIEHAKTIVLRQLFPLPPTQYRETGIIIFLSINYSADFQQFMGIFLEIDFSEKLLVLEEFNWNLFDTMLNVTFYMYVLLNYVPNAI